MDYNQLSDQDKLIWKQAKKRVSFRRHLFCYLIINAFVWATWSFHFFTREIDTNMNRPNETWHHFHLHGAPIFMTLGWGIGLAFHYYSAYIDNKYTAVEKEFEKLKNSGK